MQVATGAFLGGPLAATHCLWSNFMALGKPRSAYWALNCGLAATAVIVALAFLFASKQLNGLWVSFVVIFASALIAERYQLSKAAIRASDSYAFQSNWKVLGLGLLWLAVTMLFITILVVLLLSAGIQVIDTG
jgi:hypothetical protein